MSDILEKDLTRESFGAQAGEAPTPPQPPYCIDVVTEVPTYTTYFFTRNDGQISSILVSTGTTSVVSHQCFPGSPGTPGTAAVPGSVTVNFNLGWNGSATSIGTFEGDQMAQFSFDASNVGVVCGLNDVNEGSGYIEMEHSVYGASGQLQVVENGVVKTAPVVYDTDDVITLVRMGTTVTYWLNSTLLYTSLTPSSGTKFLDVSMFAAGDKVY